MRVSECFCFFFVENERKNRDFVSTLSTRQPRSLSVLTDLRRVLGDADDLRVRGRKEVVS